MRKKLLLAVLFIVLTFSFFYFDNQIVNAESSICWDCISDEGVDYRCLGVYDGFENCGQTSPDNCILTGPGCNVG